MRALKLICLSILCTVFTRGNAYVASITFHNDLSSEYNRDEVNVLKHTFSNHILKCQPAVKKKYRKYRRRGISTGVPCIAAKALKKKFDFKNLPISSVDGAYASFLYCADSKRGPPNV